MNKLNAEKFDAVWAKYNPDNKDWVTLEEAVLMVKDYHNIGEKSEMDDHYIMKVISMTERKRDWKITKDEMTVCIMYFH